MQIHIRNESQLGVALKRFRKRKQLTQSDLASDACLRQATVSKAESGSGTMQLSTYLSLLRVLGLEIVVQPRSKISAQQYVDSFSQ